jgi:hypothetical protein
MQAILGVLPDRFDCFEFVAANAIVQNDVAKNFDTVFLEAFDGVLVFVTSAVLGWNATLLVKLAKVV